MKKSIGLLLLLVVIVFMGWFVFEKLTYEPKAEDAYRIAIKKAKAKYCTYPAEAEYFDYSNITHLNNDKFRVESSLTEELSKSQFLNITYKTIDTTEFTAILKYNHGFLGRWQIIEIKEGHTDEKQELDRDRTQDTTYAEKNPPAILSALEKNDVEKIKQLLKSRVAEKQKNEALWKAVKDNNIEIVRILIDAGAALDSVNYEGYTPLVNLIEPGSPDEEMMKLLADNTLDLETPLLIAFENRDIKTCELLLDKGTNINIKDPDGFSLLMNAVFDANLELVKFLIESGASINSEDKYGSNALVEAAERGYTDIAEYLIKKGSNKLNSALCEAVYNNNVEIVRLLVDAGANIDMEDEYGGTLLTDALYDNYYEIAKILIDAGIHKKGLALWDEISNSGLSDDANIEIINKLIAAGADLNYKYSGTGTVVDGYTPLMLAIDDNNVKVAKILIDAGADLDLQGNDYSKDTALYLAAIEGNEEIVKLLLEADADVNGRNGHQKTPLMAAAKRGYFNIVKILIENGAGSDIQDEDGNTAIDYARDSGDKKIVSYLGNI